MSRPSRPSIDQQVTFLYTPDLTKTARFYEEIIGLEMVLDQGVCRIYQITDTAFVGFCERATANGRDSDVIITLVTDEVDAWHEYLLAHDVDIEKPPTLNEDYNIYHIFVRDPGGYLLEIQTFKDPAWRRVDS